MPDSTRCSTCGADLDDPGTSAPICVSCAYGFAQNLGSMAPGRQMTGFALSSEADGEEIGPYRLLGLIGEGGMGTVWEALQEAPVRRRVALKRIKVGLDSAQVLARFDSERQALALMSHPHIAQVFDAGRTRDGHPYFAMEFIEGAWLTDYCDAQKLPVPKRLDLFLMVCEAIQHAHHKGVIHRDIKPSNILVQTEEGRPIPKVIDFGVAKAMGTQLTERTLVTQFGQALGTPEYMSPEQAGAVGFDVDTRADVYSLGVVLYELLTGRLPFEAAGGDYDELRRRIREEDPSLPSARVAASGAEGGEAARSRGTEPAALVRRLRGDLDWIAMKTLAKDRGQRYGSPGELAADLRRHLAGQPVLAGPPSAAYRLSKFVRRHAVGVTAAAAIVLILVATAAGMWVQARRVARERDRANQEAQTAGAALEFLTGIFRLSDPEKARGETITAREVLDRGAADLEQELKDAPEVQAALTLAIGKVYRNLGLYSRAEELLEEAVQARRRLRGPDDPAALRLTSEIAWLYILQGRPKEAEALELQTLGIQKRVLGPEHTDTLDSMNNLANGYQDQGRYKEAEALHRETLEIRKRVLGHEHADTTSSMNNLANAYGAQGRYREAEALFLQTLEIRKRVLGIEDPLTLSSMYNYAIMHFLGGRYKEAEALFRETLDVQKRVLGPEHHETLRSMNNLAETLSAEGRHQEAEALFLQAFELMKRVLGPEHPDTLSLMDSFGKAFGAQRRNQEAEALCRQTLDIRRRVLGPEHPDTLNSMNSLAVAYRDQGRYKDAEAMHRETLEIQKRVLGPEHPATLASMINAACAAARRGTRPEALRYLREAVGHGFSDVKLLLEDANLASLRDDPDFAKIAATARANREREAGSN